MTSLHVRLCRSKRTIDTPGAWEDAWATLLLHECGAAHSSIHHITRGEQCGGLWPRPAAGATGPFSDAWDKITQRDVPGFASSSIEATSLVEPDDGTVTL